MFSSLSQEELSDLATISVPKHFDEGQAFFYEGDPCEGLYVVASGSVRIIKTSPSGRQLLIGVESAPSTVAEVPIFDAGPCPATVIAAEPSLALFVLRRDFRALCLRHPDVAWKMTAVVSARLRHLVSLIERISFGSIRQRLAQTLLAEAHRHPEDTFPLPGTHEEMAVQLGTVREVISRNLSRFQAEGFIRLERRAITVLNPAGLRAEAESEM